MAKHGKHGCRECCCLLYWETGWGTWGMNPDWKMCHNYADPLKVRTSGMGVTKGGRASGGLVQ
jgi:hypothetical protein